MTKKFKVLIADDEPDIHAVTRLSLKGVKRNGVGIEVLSAASGKEAVDMLRATPDIAVVLLDVVMESDTAGLDACRTIRGELGNAFVRILLRTGQPGAAPERQTIDEYDIDGYLPKAELSSTRLYSAVRTALKAYDELVELDRHRKHLAALHDCVIALRSFAPLADTLDRVLRTALTICPAPLAVLHLETFEEQGNPRRFSLHVATSEDMAAAQASADAVRAAVVRAGLKLSSSEPMLLDGGFVVPLNVHRELGHGWIYVAEPSPDARVLRMLPLLAAHAANALYSTIAEAILKGRQAPLFDAMSI